MQFKPYGHTAPTVVKHTLSVHIYCRSENSSKSKMSQFVLFYCVVAFLLLFMPSHTFLLPSLNLSTSSSISTTRLPVAMELCIVCFTEAVRLLADLASDHKAQSHTVTQTLLCKHTCPLSYIWEIKNIHDELELYVKSNAWIIYVHNQPPYADVLVYSH